MFNTNPIIGLLQWPWYPNCPNVWECGSDRHRLKTARGQKTGMRAAQAAGVTSISWATHNHSPATHSNPPPPSATAAAHSYNSATWGPRVREPNLQRDRRCQSRPGAAYLGWRRAAVANSITLHYAVPRVPSNQPPAGLEGAVAQE